MVIYGNNIHEKLFGSAISKEYIAYATPYCELVDDPDFEVDVDIAVNFHAAWNNGDIDAARRAINALVINSANLDQSTLNFYSDKMKSHPFFSSEIDRINAIFNDPRYPDIDRGESEADFVDALKEAASDCWNSPCNIFSETSDSIGRLAQVGSTKNSSNSFSVGSLSGIAANLVNGIDDAVMKSIPEMFSKSINSITRTATRAWDNTQEAFTGKDNIEDVLNHLVDNGYNARSYRDSNGQPLLYTPDVKSFFDLDQVATNILAEISAELGGCTDKFQNALRYNPYSDNTSTPTNISTGQVNGKKYTQYPDGRYTTVNLGTPAATQSPTSQGGIRFSDDPSIVVTDPGVTISRPGIFSPQNIGSVGSYYDKQEKILILESSSNPDRVSGKTGIAKIAEYCPSGINQEGDGNKATLILQNKTAKLDETGGFILNKLANNYTFSEGDDVLGHTGHFNLTEVPKEFNEGVFLSNVFLKFFNGLSDIPSSLIEAVQEKAVYAIITPIGTQDRKLIRVIGPGIQNSGSRLDLTPAAYKTVFGTLPKTVPNKDLTTSKFKDNGWEVYTNTVAHTVDCEVRLAIGDPYDILAVVDELLPSTTANAIGDDLSDQTAIIYNISGKKRPLPIHPDLEQALVYAAGAVNAQKVVVTSGGQTARNQYGSSRHNVFSNSAGYGGMAADFKVYDSNGRLIPISDNDSWTRIARRFVNFTRNMGYIPAGGAGPNYMGDSVHFDIARGLVSFTPSNFFVDTTRGRTPEQKIQITPWLKEFK